MERQPEYDCGVIVGRFQVHELHQGHRDLIDHVCEHHPKVLIVLGTTETINTRNNPLDFESRKQMILSEYPNVTVLYLKDAADDAVWSHRLDQLVGGVVGPMQSTVLYGGRDSFIRVYAGKYPTTELVQEGHSSGTDVRRMISREVRASADFRAGVIWASAQRYPVCYPTVDCVVFSQGYSHVLLGRKDGESLFRIIGGFAEPSSTSYEDDARREVREEADVIVEDLHYVGSFRVKDWRYAGEVDKIKTLLFTGSINHLAKPVAGDDLVEVKEFKITDLDVELDIMPLHRPLLKAALDTLVTKPTVKGSR